MATAETCDPLEEIRKLWCVLLTLGTVLALALYGLRMALAGRSLFSDRLLEGEAPADA